MSDNSVFRGVIFSLDRQPQATIYLVIVAIPLTPSKLKVWLIVDVAQSISPSGRCWALRSRC